MGQFSDAEREELCAYLTRGGDEFLSLTSSLSNAQWLWRPRETGWTCAECAEHVLIVESGLLRRVLAVMGSAPEVERAARVAGREKKMVERMPLRQVKVDASAALRPAGRFATPGEFAERFAAQRGETVQLIQTTGAPVHHVVEPHFIIGDLTAAQWFWFIGAHGARHLNQMREIQSLDGFPAS